MSVFYESLIGVKSSAGTDRAGRDWTRDEKGKQGGAAGRTLFMLTSSDAYPKRLVGTQLSRVDTVIVDTPGVEGER